MYHTIYTVCTTLSFLYTTTTSSMFSIETVPHEVFHRILFQALKPHSTNLATIRSVSQKWYNSTLSDSFKDLCTTNNIPLTPIIIFYNVNKNSRLPSTPPIAEILKTGLSPLVERELAQYYPGQQLFLYINPTNLNILSNKRHIFWNEKNGEYHFFIGLPVNPLTTFVFNSYLRLSDKKKFKKSKMTLFQYALQENKKRNLIITPNQEIVLHNITAEPEIRTKSPNSFLSAYVNAIAIKCPIAGDRFIKDGSLFSFEIKSPPTDMLKFINETKPQSKQSADIAKKGKKSANTLASSKISKPGRQRFNKAIQRLRAIKHYLNQLQRFKRLKKYKKPE